MPGFTGNKEGERRQTLARKINLAKEFRLLFSNPNYQMIEGILRGAGRKFADAERLGLIDLRMQFLVRGLNALAGVETTACCEGHGALGRYSTPYVAFTAPADIACRFQISLDEASNSERKIINYWWDMEGRYRADGTLVYRVSASSLNRYFWVTRTKLDADFETILKLFQNAHSNNG